MGGAVVKASFGRVDRPLAAIHRVQRQTARPSSPLSKPPPQNSCQDAVQTTHAIKCLPKKTGDSRSASSNILVEPIFTKCTDAPESTPENAQEISAKKPTPESTAECNSLETPEVCEKNEDLDGGWTREDVEEEDAAHDKGMGGLIAVGGTLPNYPGFYATSLKSKFWQYWIYDEKKGWVLVADEITPFKVKNKKDPVRTVKDWEEFFDPQSRASYYVNVVTGHSTWDPPPCFQAKARQSKTPRVVDEEGDDLEAMIDSWEGVVQQRSGLDAISAKLMKLFDDRTKQMVNVLESRLEDKQSDIAQVKSEILKVREEMHSAGVKHHDLNIFNQRLSDVESRQSTSDRPAVSTLQPSSSEALSTLPPSSRTPPNFKFRSSELPKLQVPPCVPSHVRHKQLRGQVNQHGASSQT